MALQLQKTKNWLKIFSLSSLLITAISCSNNEDLIVDTEDINITAKSSKSVQLFYNSITASAAQNANPIENIDDNDSSLSTRWSGNGRTTNVDMDFGVETAFDYVNIAFHKGDERKAFFSYWQSDDGSNWTEVGTKTSSGITASHEEFDLSNFSARYFRIVFEGNENSTWNSVLDLEVYGTPGEEIVTRDNDTTDNEESNSSGIFNFGGVFDIETSDNCGSDTGTDTKDYATLENNTSSTQDGLVFFENINGNYILQSCADDGTRTEWKQSSTFSLNDSRKISYNANFYDYPSAGVTIAQVHNRGGAGRPLLRVEIANDEIHFVIVDTYEKGEGSSHTIVGPDYTEGTDLDLSIEVGNDEIIVDVTTTNGTETATYTRNNNNDDYNIDDSWFTTSVEKNNIRLDEGFYFKSGVYNDSGNGSDNPKGEFTSFNYED